MFQKSLILILIITFLVSCSSSYKMLSNDSFEPKNEFSKHLFELYKSQADFEANEMHDWNSTKLYSEKAIQGANGIKVVPNKISERKISNEHLNELNKAYDNLMKVYFQAIEITPYDLADAISSLDCWAEQQEENWQLWDINNCRDRYLKAMHNIYNAINSNEEKIKDSVSSEDAVVVVTKDKNNKIKQIIYFDFDKSKINNVNLIEIESFLEKNKNNIKEYLIVGHTDTKGSKEYNMELSMKRAESVKNILIQYGINEQNIKLLAKGESELAKFTKDDVAHPANRRAEIIIGN